MEIVTVQFNYPGRANYKILLDVFRYSIKLYMPEAKLIEYKIKAPPELPGRPLNFKYNTEKLKIWMDHLNKTKDNVIFADCDMMMIKSAGHAFDIPFDVAYTARTILVRIPMNGGIMMVRPTDKAKKFFKEMYEVDVHMLHNPGFHQQWRVRYAGMNQSAFGYCLEKGNSGAKLHKYITREWNAVDCDWGHITNKTVFVHYKSKLRKLVLKNAPPHGEYKKVMSMWYDMRKRMEGKR